MSGAPPSGFRRRALVVRPWRCVSASASPLHLLVHSTEGSTRRSRVLNTTKCDNEKLTTKLTAMANNFAASTGSQYEATTRIAVLVITPATPEATNAP